jgi:V/A-type H+-transporting ATPase subunit I
MAIVQMKRFELFSFSQSAPRLHRALQLFRDVHFYDLRLEEQLEDVPLHEAVDQEALEEKETLLSQLRWMLKILSPYDQRPKGLKAMKDGLDVLTLQELEQKARSIDYRADFERLSGLHRQKEDLEVRIHSLEEKIRDRAEWETLTIPLETLTSGDSVDMFLGTIPKKLTDALDEALEGFELSYRELISDRGPTYHYLFVSHKSEREAFRDTLRRYGFSEVSFPKGKTIAALQEESREEIQRLKAEAEKIENQIAPMVENLPQYEAAYDYESNVHLKIETAKKFLRTEKIEWIRGYVPAEKEAELRKTLDETLPEGYHLEIEDAVAEDPQVPIALKNNRFVDSFSSITTMYTLPTYDEIDPTPFFAPFYWVFFGMMAADIAYGAIVFVATQLVLRLFNLKPSMKKFVRFFSYLSISMIIWGFVYGSFFGDLIPLPSLFDTQQDFIPMLIMSIAFGAVHLFFGLGLSAYLSLKHGDWQGAVFDVLFWYMALIGAVLFGLGALLALSPTLVSIAKWMMIAGMVGIVLTGGREAKSVGGKLAMGIYSLYNITGYIGDFVSYSRLMALGLAGGFIGLAVNLIVGMLSGLGIPGILAGAVVFVIFHLFNIFLSMLSAYVHTSRLTYVEFFGKFYEGGGVPFRPFIKEPKYSQFPENH